MKANILLNMKSGILTPAKAPSTVLGNQCNGYVQTLFNVFANLFKKTNVAGNAWAIIAIRLVPFATVDGIPKESLLGGLLRAAPATVFITPATVPTKISDTTITRFIYH